MYSRSRHLRFLTFTSPDWTIDHERTCPELNEFAEAVVALRSDMTDITGTWLAIEVARSNQPNRTRTSALRWQWHIHGLVLSKTVRRPIESLTSLCQEHNVSLHVKHKEGPADTFDRSEWSTQKELAGLIRYCDKSQQSTLHTTTEEIARKVSLSSSINQYATGELAMVAADELVLRTIASFKEGLLKFREQLGAPATMAFDAGIASLDNLATLVRDKRNQSLDLLTAIEYLADTIAFVRQLVSNNIRWLICYGAKRYDQIAKKPFQGLSLQLAVGCEILSMRSTRRRDLWPQIEQLGNFWTSRVYGESAKRLRTRSWLDKFVAEVFEQQLGLVLPNSGI